MQLILLGILDRELLMQYFQYPEKEVPIGAILGADCWTHYRRNLWSLFL